MKISYNWLKEYIKTDKSAEEIGVLLTSSGLEVEGIEKVESIKGGLEGLVIGKVMSCERHPNADKLSKTTVDLGDGILVPIVCGAPNVAEGQKVVVATVGTTLYHGDDSFVINKSKIRGEVSEGMICAEDEIGLGNSHAGIIVLPEDAPVGQKAADFFNIESDYMLEIGLTPNRSDATSHIGVARDLAAIINKNNNNQDCQIEFPNVESFKTDEKDLKFNISIDNPESCGRYTGLALSNIEVKESPEWLKNRLKTIGIRPINNVVDITNYVLMETGQPLHAFDYDKISSKNIRVRKLAEGTIFKTLDEVERKLGAGDLMICDEDKPMCMAGIFGGHDSGITEGTKNIFLESAYFDAATIRKSSKNHGLKTDASFRFERGADPNITVYAIKRAAILLKELAGAKISSDILDVYPSQIEDFKFDFSMEYLTKSIGREIPEQLVINILISLGIKITENNGGVMKLEVPTFKVDVTRPIDVVEEVVRIFGYDNIIPDDQIRSSISYSVKPDNEKLVNLISDHLVSLGFMEAMNNSLTKSSYFSKYGFEEKNNVVIINPLSSELNVLRQDLIFGLLESANLNQSFKQKNIRLFEFGKTYFYDIEKEDRNLNRYKESKRLSIILMGDETPENWKSKSNKTDFYSIKNIFVSILQKAGYQLNEMKVEEFSSSGYFAYGLNYSLRGKSFAKVGILNKEIAKQFDLEGEAYFCDIDWMFFVNGTVKNKVSFNGLPKFPVVRRDLALLIDKNVRYQDLEKLAIKLEPKLLVEINLFDVYEGKGIPEGKKSYAMSFKLLDETKTLTDKQIEKIMSRFQYGFEQSFGAVLR